MTGYDSLSQADKQKIDRLMLMVLSCIPQHRERALDDLEESVAHGYASIYPESPRLAALRAATLVEIIRMRIALIADDDILLAGEAMQ